MIEVGSVGASLAAVLERPTFPLILLCARVRQVFAWRLTMLLCFCQ